MHTHVMRLHIHVLLLRLVKAFIVDVYILYGEDTCPSHRQCQTLAGDAGPVTGGGGLRVSEMGKLQDEGKFHVFSCKVHCDCGSTHCYHYYTHMHTYTHAHTYIYLH